MESIAFPRAAGTEEEKRVRAYCIGMLRDAGLQVHEQPFSFSSLPDTLTRLLPFIGGIILLTIAMLFTAPSLTAAGILGALLLAAFIISRLPLPLGKLHDIFSRLHSANVTGNIPASGTMKQRIVIMAHYDSKSQVLPIAARAICSICLVFSAFILLLSHAAPFFVNGIPYRIISLSSGYSALVCSVLMLFNFTRNRSPGAADNAAGVAVLLELARIFSIDPLRNIQLIILVTGAEEYGMAGAYRFIESQPDLEPETHYINIDGVGGNASVGLIGCRRKGIQNNGASLADGLTTTARMQSMHIVKLSAAIGIGFDHIAAESSGHEAVTLCSPSPAMIFRIHSPRDTIEQIMPESIENIGRLCETYLRELDKRT